MVTQIGGGHVWFGPKGLRCRMRHNCVTNASVLLFQLELTRLKNILLMMKFGRMKTRLGICKGPNLNLPTSIEVCKPIKKINVEPSTLGGSTSHE